MTGDVFVGVDAGASRARAVVEDDAGRLLAREQGAGALADPHAPEAAAAVVADLALRALSSAGAAIPCRALWAGVAGTGREGVRSAVEQALAGAGVSERLRVGTDIEAAYHDAFGEGPGVLVAAGTGSVAQGVGEDGRRARVGGWGSLLGDEGSGYAIGLGGLRSVLRTADGRGPETQLRTRLLDRVPASGPQELVAWAQSADKADIAALAPAVAGAAADGDTVARDILAGAVAELEGHVLTLLANLGPWAAVPTVALAGGLLGPGGSLRERFEEALRGHPVRLLEQEVDAARGAAALARQLLES